MAAVPAMAESALESTKAVVDTLLESQGAAAAPATERERSADEDPLARQQAQISEGAETPEAAEEAPNELDLYGSLRVRYRSTLGEHGFGDGGSRIGVQGRYQLWPGRWLFARAEAGFNLLDELGGLVNGNNPSGGVGDTFFRRLLNVGYESPNLFIVLGKTWSVYYQISSFTDRFAGAGGAASGTYNAGTDGGYTGTGRADRAVQTRLLVDFLPGRWGIEPFRLNIQLQDGEPIPGIRGYHYGPALGLSALLVTRDHFSFGIAYNEATVPDAGDPVLRQRGIDGDARALIFGARWLDDDWYLATVLARLENQEATDQGNYFDGWGSELYLQYRLRGRWWLTGGWNWLRPDSGQPLAGDFRIKYGLIGLRYSIRDFERYLYVNARADHGRDQDGTDAANMLTIGLRWDF